jgi:hypothetical protein
MIDYENDPDLEPSEPITQEFGLGDGATTMFTGYVRCPVPGTVVVRVVSDDAVSQLGRLADPTSCYASVHDITKDGVLHGRAYSGSVLYDTGAVEVTWQDPPPSGSRVELVYRRWVHKRRDWKMEIIDSNGDRHVVSVEDFHKIGGFF